MKPYHVIILTSMILLLACSDEELQHPNDFVEVRLITHYQNKVPTGVYTIVLMDERHTGDSLYPGYDISVISSKLDVLNNGSYITSKASHSTEPFTIRKIHAHHDSALDGDTRLYYKNQEETMFAGGITIVREDEMDLNSAYTIELNVQTANGPLMGYYKGPVELVSQMHF